MKKWMWLAGLSLLLLCLWTVMEKGSGYFGKAYTNTQSFRYDFTDMYSDDILCIICRLPPYALVDFADGKDTARMLHQ
ncbi:hypothetical protein KTG14_17775 [Planococcus sp. CP5-4_YE]|nr:hypothetical protein [Planococcus sp. CP5-4_YE]